jgi:hypothetical protein
MFFLRLSSSRQALQKIASIYPPLLPPDTLHSLCSSRAGGRLLEVVRHEREFFWEQQSL